MAEYMTVKEHLLQRLTEDCLIEVYVPECGQLTREEALALALERDLEAAKEAETSLRLAQAAQTARVALTEDRTDQILRELGYS
jgi:hypothetical protein